MPELILIGKNQKESQKLRQNNPDKLVFTAGDLLLPVMDINGEIQSVQTIQPNGTKRLKRRRKKTLFHIVGSEGLMILPKLR